MLKILLIEDDSSFGYILSEYLGLKNMSVRWCKNGATGLDAAITEPFDLCILDIMLPDTDGFAIAAQLRRKRPQLPFIFLTARNLKIDQLKGYRLGGDDYLTKPVDEELLVAKIEAIVHRSGNVPSGQPEILSIGTYQFNPVNQQLIHQGEARQLTEREAALLEAFARQRGILVDRKEILRSIWGSTDEFSRKSMDVFISRLRKYLSQDPCIRLRNVHGRGFILEIRS
ncbi:MAG: response regulator transcription factor [Bacteroidota bacterium]